MVFDPLELELMAIVSCLIGVLGTEPRSYAGTTAPTHGAVSSMPFYQILTIVVWYSPACALYHILLLYAFNHSFNKHRSALRQASAHIRLMSDYCLVLNAGLVSRVSSTSRMNGFLGRGERWGTLPSNLRPSRSIKLRPFSSRERLLTPPLFQAKTSFSGRTFASQPLTLERALLMHR